MLLYEATTLTIMMNTTIRVRSNDIRLQRLRMVLKDVQLRGIVSEHFKLLEADTKEKKVWN